MKREPRPPWGARRDRLTTQHNTTQHNTTQHTKTHKMIANSLLKEQIAWATTAPPKVVKQKGTTVAKQKKLKQQEEKEWGNKMIGQVGNGQWTTLLGEYLVRDILAAKGERVWRPEKRGGFQPDWESDNYIYEVKTSNWCVDGTAGEKVLGTWIKYQDIPELYGKPLRIICVARQEHELEFGKVKYFGDEVTEKTRSLLALASAWQIEYVRFSDLVQVE